MLKITTVPTAEAKAEALPNPFAGAQASPFAFDPDTQPGERVQCVSDYANELTFLKHYEVSGVTGDGPYVRNDDGQYHVYSSDCFQNIHRNHQGQWVLGRDPALVKAKEPPTYNMTQAASKALPGDVFRTVNAFQGQTEFFVCVGEGWVTRDNGVDVWFTVENIDAYGERDLHYLGNHTLELKVGGPVKHPSETLKMSPSEGE